MRDTPGSEGFAVAFMEQRHIQHYVAVLAIAGEMPMKLYIVPGFQTDLGRHVIKEGAVEWMETVERNIVTQAPWYGDFQSRALTFVNFIALPNRALVALKC